MAWGNFAFAGQRRAEGGLDGVDAQGRARAMLGSMFARGVDQGGLSKTSAQEAPVNPFQNLMSASPRQPEAPAQSALASSTLLRAGGMAEAPQQLAATGMPAAPVARPTTMPQNVAANMNAPGGPAGFDLEELLAILRGKMPGEWDPERRSVVQTKPSIEEQASFAANPDMVMLNSIKNMWRSS